MDINSINSLTNANIGSSYGALYKEDAKINSFKDILEEASKDQSDKEIKTAAKEMESYFINMLFKQMRKSVKSTGGLFEKSFAQETFEEMLDEQYADLATESGGIGLADAIYEQMKKGN